MAEIDRRAMLGALVSGAAGVAMGLVVMPGRAQSTPLTTDADRPGAPENSVEKAVWVRRRRVRRCWWHHGRRVCRWVWVR
jgi:hypothetical protein